MYFSSFLSCHSSCNPSVLSCDIFEDTEPMIGNHWPGKRNKGMINTDSPSVGNHQLTVFCREHIPFQLSFHILSLLLCYCNLVSGCAKLTVPLFLRRKDVMEGKLTTLHYLYLQNSLSIARGHGARTAWLPFPSKRFYRRVPPQALFNSSNQSGWLMWCRQTVLLYEPVDNGVTG